jgi:hypothetical protein
VSASRYRCNACGNLTRFDVTTSRRTRAYHHYTVGGELQVEDLDVLSETVEDVSCRWCGTGGSVVELSAEDAAAIAGSGAGGPAGDEPPT